MATIRLALGEASFTAIAIAPAVAIHAVAALVAVNRRISSIRLDDGTDDNSSEFRGCFISHPQKFSYIDGDLVTYILCRNPSFRLATKARGCKEAQESKGRKPRSKGKGIGRVRAKRRKLGSHHIFPGV